MTRISTVKDFMCRHMLRHVCGDSACLFPAYAATALVSAVLHFWLLLFLVPVVSPDNSAVKTRWWRFRKITGEF